MQIKHLTGTNVGHINIKSGAKLICLLCLLATLIGCQRHVLIDLLNESGDVIQVVGYSSGHPVERTLENHDRVSVLSPVPLVIRERGQTQSYFIESIPQEFMQSKFEGRLISIELESDKKLYLLKIGENPPTILAAPQPVPFPITAKEIKSNSPANHNRRGTKSYAYNSIGDLLTNHDFGSGAYSYGAKPHAVTSANGTSYADDACGNMTTRGGQTLTLTELDTPTVALVVPEK